MASWPLFHAHEGAAPAGRGPSSPHLLLGAPHARAPGTSKGLSRGALGRTFLFTKVAKFPVDQNHSSTFQGLVRHPVPQSARVCGAQASLPGRAGQLALGVGAGGGGGWLEQLTWAFFAVGIGSRVCR